MQFLVGKLFVKVKKTQKREDKKHNQIEYSVWRLTCAQMLSNRQPDQNHRIQQLERAVYQLRILTQHELYLFHLQ